MKTKVLSVLVMLFMFAAVSQAQEYKSAIGGKLGYGLIATYKTFLNEKSAIDIFGGIRWGGIAAGAYYLNHTPIASVDKLSWYWGFGGSFTTWDYGYPGLDSYYELGVSGVLGLDYAYGFDYKSLRMESIYPGAMIHYNNNFHLFYKIILL